MASTQTITLNAAAPPPILTNRDSPILVTSGYRGPLAIILVGAGGTGARVIPPLMQMLRRNDRVFIVDHDIVEDRNLQRQHFASRDIGAPKALVLAERYRRTGIEVVALHTQLKEANAGVFQNALVEPVRGGANPCVGVVFLGCVDNAAARRAIQYHLRNVPEYLGLPHAAWIDVGNEMRGGQVLLTLQTWPVKVQGGQVMNSSLVGLATAMPQLLKDPLEETVSCGERIDLQTVQVNHLASSAMINMLSWLTLGIPFTSAGAFFSTLNTMQPIPLVSFDPTRRVLAPDTSFAVAS